MNIISDCSVVLGHVDPVPLVPTLGFLPLRIMNSAAAADVVTLHETDPFILLIGTYQVNWFRSHRLIPSRLLMLGHLELLPDAAAADADSMFSLFPRLGSETPTSAGTDISERMYSILSFFPRHAQWVGTFGNRVMHAGT
jgi:hypothetical protein